MGKKIILGLVALLTASLALVSSKNLDFRAEETYSKLNACFQEGSLEFVIESAFQNDSVVSNFTFSKGHYPPTFLDLDVNKSKGFDLALSYEDIREMFVEMSLEKYGSSDPTKYMKEWGFSLSDFLRIEPKEIFVPEELTFLEWNLYLKKGIFKDPVSIDQEKSGRITYDIHKSLPLPEEMKEKYNIKYDSSTGTYYSPYGKGHIFEDVGETI